MAPSAAANDSWPARNAKHSVSSRSGDAEALQTDADGLSSLGSCLDLLLDCDGGTAHISPFCILEADALGVLANLVGVNTYVLANLVCLFYVFDAVGVEGSQNLLDSALLALETYFSYHCVDPPVTLFVGQYS